MHRLYANTLPLYLGNLSIRGFWYLWGSWLFKTNASSRPCFQFFGVCTKLSSEEKEGIKAKRRREAFHKESVTCAKAARALIQLSWRVGMGGEIRGHRERQRLDGKGLAHGKERTVEATSRTEIKSLLLLLFFKCLRVCSVTSVVSDSIILPTVAHQAPLSVGLSRQEYWSE